MGAGGEPRIAIEVSGGVDGPETFVTAAAGISLHGRSRLLLVGDGERLGAELRRHSYDPMRLRIVDAGVRQGKGSGDHLAREAAARVSLPVAFELVRAGEADALITAASGALVLHCAEAGLRALAPGVPAALAAVVPTMPRPGHADPLALLLDTSGRAAASAEALHGFAVMGGAYARLVSGIRQPRVALLSTSTDPGAGPAAVVAAHAALRRAPNGGLNFIGGVGAIDIPRGQADVIVVDGFTGAAVRGLLEGITDLTVEAARYAWKARTTWRVGLRLLSDGVGQLRKVSEFREYGGAPLLGLDGVVLVAAPEAGVEAIANAIKLAGKCVHADIVRELEAELRLARPGMAAGGSDGG